MLRRAGVKTLLFRSGVGNPQVVTFQTPVEESCGRSTHVSWNRYRIRGHLLHIYRTAGSGEKAVPPKETVLLWQICKEAK